MKIIVATHNEGKLAEIRRILEDVSARTPPTSSSSPQAPWDCPIRSRTA